MLHLLFLVMARHPQCHARLRGKFDKKQNFLLTKEAMRQVERLHHHKSKVAPWRVRMEKICLSEGIEVFALLNSPRTLQWGAVRLVFLSLHLMEVDTGEGIADSLNFQWILRQKRYQRSRGRCSNKDVLWQSRNSPFVSWPFEGSIAATRAMYPANEPLPGHCRRSQ